MLKAGLCVLSTRPADEVSVRLHEWQSCLPGLETADPAGDFGVWDLLVVFIASGGTETRLKAIADRLPTDTILLAADTDNGLAAGLESLAFLRECRGYRRRLYLAGPEQGFDARVLDRYLQARRRWHGGRIGLFGGRSDWLIASGYDEDAVRRRLGMEFIRIPRASLRERVGEALAGIEGDEARCQALADHLHAWEQELQLAAWALRCFELIPEHGVTGCLAISQAGDRGVPAACEGDVPALLSQLIAGGFTGQAVFQANPCHLDRERGELTVAHCTLPSSLVGSVRRMTHYESGQGVALRGEFRDEHYALYRVDGRLASCSLYFGRRQERPWREDLCRSQLTLKTDPPPQQLLEESFGNHRAIFPLEPADHAVFAEYASLFLA